MEEIPDPFVNPDKPIAITFDEITSAAYRIKSGIRYTECAYSEHLSNLTGMEIYVKKEFLQATGSFKERGARYSMMMLTPEQKSKGIVAASAGNHAQACCYHGNMLGIPVTVFMPVSAPIMKVQKCKEYKGNVKIIGEHLTESKKHAMAYARDNGMIYLNGYDHPKVLAGQGTVGLEVWEQVPNIDAVVVPVGGGGLIAGVSNAIKALDKNIKVIGVEPERAASLTAALEAGRPVDVKIGSTLADGLAVGKFGYNSFESIKKTLDKCVTVAEQYIALAVLKLVECEKSVVEGAGATPLAAILQGLLPEFKGKKVCLILTGGNIDTTVLGRVLDRGMAAEGRLVKVKVVIPDRVGGIEQLTRVIGNIGVHIKDISHERAWVTEDVFSVEVKVVCECSGREQSIELKNLLTEKYGRIVFNGSDYPSDASGKSTVFAPLQDENRLPQISSEPDKPSIQQQVIDFETQPQKTASKEKTSSPISSKRPSQHDGSQTEGNAQPLGIVPRLSKQSTSSANSPQQQDGSSQKPEKIEQPASKASALPADSSTHSATSKKDSTGQSPKDYVKPRSSVTSAEEPVTPKTATEDGKHSSPGNELPISPRGSGPQSVLKSPTRGSSIHSEVKSAGSQTATSKIPAPTKSIETASSGPQKSKPSITETPRPLSACNCKRRGAPGEYELKK